MPNTVIDPGHGGGSHASGRSTPGGGRGSVTVEKDVTLRLARAVRERLQGQAVLSRDDDLNPSLAERIALSRDAADGAASVFLSIHANSGPPSASGAEVYVHDRASAESHALARVLVTNLAAAQPRVKSAVCVAPLAVLHPDWHAAKTAGALVEVDYLTNPEGERLLTDAAGIDVVAAALADAIRAHLAARETDSQAVPSAPPSDRPSPHATASINLTDSGNAGEEEAWLEREAETRRFNSRRERRLQAERDGTLRFLPVRGIENVSDTFKDIVFEIAEEIEVDVNHLMALMSFESAGTFSPSIENFAGSGAVGLIQFMPSTARSLGTTTTALKAMSAIEQLEWVRKYFLPVKGRLRTLESTYMAVLWPAGIGKSAGHVLWRRGSKEYRQNSGLDSSGDGTVTVGEAAGAVRRVLTAAENAAGTPASGLAFRGHVRQTRSWRPFPTRSPSAYGRVDRSSSRYLRTVVEALDAGEAQYEWWGVDVEHNGYIGIFWVFADAMKDAANGQRIPCRAAEAQIVADRITTSPQQFAPLGWTNPPADKGEQPSLFLTPKLMDIRWENAARQDKWIDPCTGDITAPIKSESKRLNDCVDARMAAKSTTIAADPGKIWALTNGLGGMTQGGETAVNYGWHVHPTEGVADAPTVRAMLPGQKVIQGPFTAHNAYHIDYSQILLLVSGWCQVIAPGEELPRTLLTKDVYKSKELAPLVTGSGRPLRFLKQPYKLSRLRSAEEAYWS